MRAVLQDKSIRQKSDKTQSAVLFIISSGFRRNLCNSSEKCSDAESNSFLINSVYVAKAPNYIYKLDI